MGAQFLMNLWIICFMPASTSCKVVLFDTDTAPSDTSCCVYMSAICWAMLLLGRGSKDPSEAQVIVGNRGRLCSQMQSACPRSFARASSDCLTGAGRSTKQLRLDPGILARKALGSQENKAQGGPQPQISGEHMDRSALLMQG